MRLRVLALAVLAATSSAGCGMTPPLAPAPAGSSAAPTPGPVSAPETGVLAGRPYAAYLPTTAGPRALVVFLHGGGGNATNAQASTCPQADLQSPGCLQAVGRREGFVTLFASGTPGRLGGSVRTWNAGGGGAFACASGYACTSRADDLGYLRTLLEEARARFGTDPARTYVMGFSNGGAMAHRAACQLADLVTGVVAVSGENELATNAPCAPTRPVTVVLVHGTRDPCWTYATSAASCADPDPRPKVGVRESLAGWVARDGCPGPAELGTVPDRAEDGMTSTTRTWSCSGGARVMLVTVDGGGHGFPGGSTRRERAGDPGATSDFGADLLWRLVTTAPTP